MIVEKSIEIVRPLEAVFAFVADPHNDPIWCPKVKSVERQEDREAVGPGSRFSVIHRPVPFLPARQMDYTLIEWDPPREIVWQEDDGHDQITVTYLLQPTQTGTRFAQRDDATLAAPRLLHPIMRIGIGVDIAGQLKRLRRHLERS
jgi:Polyketide cyclase / dehydrase and lipid transport